jgi:hypothetical protein
MVQIKTISFLAFMIKHRPYHEIIENDSVNFIKGLIACFKFCPAEAPHLRREVGDWETVIECYSLRIK